MPDPIRLQLAKTTATVERPEVGPALLVLDDGTTRVEFVPPVGMPGVDVGIEIKALGCRIDDLWMEAR